ncbi:MAG TPA: MoaD/ThiS family protein [Dehalococcoidales bacterium]|nr:MoaD/ThiS family protein [Dehalococcoidales bacterium]
MSLKVRIPSYFQQYTNQKEVVEVNGSTVGECLNHLVSQFPGFEKTISTNYFDIYLNGEYFSRGWSVEPVKDGDELLILFPIGCCG